MSSRAATLRIKRGAKTLSEIPLGRARLVIGGGKGAQLRLKNAGLADECLALDLRETPFAMESLLGEPIKVNGYPLSTGVVKPGDVIEFLGITLELLDEHGRDVRRAPPAPIEDDVDPFMGKATAARVKKEDVERARAKILEQRAEQSVVPEAPRNAPTASDLPAARRPAPAPVSARIPNAPRELPTARDLPAARVPVPVPAPVPVPVPVPAPAPAPAPGRSRAPTAPPAQQPSQAQRRENLPLGAVGPTGFSRPPWLEAVGDGASDARLYLMGNGVVAGRQGELKVQHASVSKKHARFEMREGALHVVDLGSTNGTWINRQRVPQGVLVDGDTLHLGSVEFHVRIPDVPKPELTTLGAEPAERTATGASRAPAALAPQPTRVSMLEAQIEAEEAQQAEEDEKPRRDREPTFDPSAVTPPPGEEELSADTSEPPLLRGKRFEPEVYEPGSGFGDDDESLALKTPEPRSRGESPFAPDAPTFDRSSSNRKDRTEPVRGSTGSVAIKAPVRVEQVAAAPRRSRGRGGAVFAAGSILALLLTGAGGVVAWPRVQARLATASASTGDAQPSDGGVKTNGGVAVAGAGTGAGTKANPKSTPAGRATPDRRIASLDRNSDAAAARRGRPDGRPTPVDDGAFLETLDAETPVPTATPEVRLGRELFGDEKFDLKGEGGRLDVARADLEKDPSGKGIRVEREIGAKELGSIYLDQGVAVVRRYHADGWDQAPSASDEVDASGRAVGAAQIDGNRVNTLIRARFDDVKKCLVGTSGFRGKARVVVQFTIMPDGRVDGLSVPSSDIKGAKFEGCVLKAVRTIKFPKPKDQSVIVQFPFVFFYQ